MDSTLVSCLDPYVAVFSKLVGPSLGKVLFTNSVGKVSITNDGASILRSISLGHPVAKLVVDNCLDHHQQFGDHVKSYILMVASALHYLDTRTLNRHLLWRNLEYLNEVYFSDNTPHSYLSEILLQTDQKSSETVHEVARQLVKSYLSSKYPENVTQLFSDLLVKVVWNLVSSDPTSTMQSAVLFYINHFDDFVVDTRATVTYSRLLDGLLIDKQLDFYSHLEDKLSSHKNRIRNAVLIMCNDSEKADDYEIDIFSISDAFEFLEPKKVLEQWVLSMKNLEVSYIFCKEKASYRFRALCEKYDLFLIDCLTEDDIRKLSFYLNVIPIHNFLEEVSSKTSVSKISLEEITVAGKSFLLVGNKCKACPQSMIVCSPSPGFSHQYKSSLINCLIILKHWFKSTQNGILLAVNPPRLFLHLHTRFSDKTMLLNEISDSNMQNTFTENNFLAFDLLKTIFILIPKNLFEQSCLHKCRGMHRFILQMNCFQSDKLAPHSPVKCNICNNCDEPTVISPLSCVLALISHVLQTVILVLKTESIVSIKSLQKLKLRNDSSSEDDD